MASWAQYNDRQALEVNSSLSMCSDCSACRWRTIWTENLGKGQVHDAKPPLTLNPLKLSPPAAEV